MSSKSVILFLVEGITDEISIGNIITKLNKDKKIYFQIINKDITSDKESNSANILMKINEQINRCIMEQHFKRKDIIKIVHIADTDGAFIKEENILFENNIDIKYETNIIKTKKPENIKLRNMNKSAILNRLCATNMINKIPYEIYFFSTNLEHVLHNIQNAKDEEKIMLADKFEDRFYDKPEKFIEFIKSKEIALEGTYEETWNYIRKDNNSLKRCTNFNLFFHN